MQLPNANPNGTASVSMMQLSLQETSTNYLQGIFEGIGSLKNILVSMRGFDKDQLATRNEELADKKVSDANQKNRDAENKRESLLGRAGGGLKQAAASVKDTGRDLTKGFSMSGLLSTLIGGAVLAAIFAPEKSRQMMQALQNSFSSLMGSEFFEEVEKAAKVIFDKFGWDNLLITGIFGWRIGALYSGLEYAGHLVKNWLGIPDVDQQKMQQGGIDYKNMPLPEKIKTWVSANFENVFKGVGLAALLMPGLFVGLIKMMGGVGWWVSKKLFSTIFLGGIAGAEALIPDAAKENLKKAGKGLKSTLRSNIGRILGISIRAIGIVGALVGLAVVAEALFSDFYDKFNSAEGRIKVLKNANNRLTNVLPKGTSDEDKSAFIEEATKLDSKSKDFNDNVELLRKKYAIREDSVAEVNSNRGLASRIREASVMTKEVAEGSQPEIKKELQKRNMLLELIASGKRGQGTKDKLAEVNAELERLGYFSKENEYNRYMEELGVQTSGYTMTERENTGNMYRSILPKKGALMPTIMATSIPDGSASYPSIRDSQDFKGDRTVINDSLEKAVKAAKPKNKPLTEGELLKLGMQEMAWEGGMGKSGMVSPVLQAKSAKIIAKNILIEARSADQAKAPTIVIPPAPPVVPSGGDSNVSAVVNHNTNVVGSLAASTGAHGTIVANLGAM